MSSTLEESRKLHGTLLSLEILVSSRGSHLTFLCVYRRDAGRHRADGRGIVADCWEAPLGLLNIILCADTTAVAGELPALRALVPPW